MDLLQTLIIFFAVVNLTFGAFLYLNSKKSLVVKLYSLIFIFATLWSVSTSLTGVSLPFQYFTLALYGHYVFGYLAYLSFFWFALYYPTRPRNSTIILASIVTFLTVVFLFCIPTKLFFTSLLPGTTLATSVIFNPLGYTTFIVMLSVVFFVGLMILLRKQRTLDDSDLYKDLDRFQIYFAILGNFVAGILGITFNLIFPLYGNFSLFYLNPILVTAVLTSIGLYNVLRYNFFNSRIILSEFFTGGIIILSLTRLVLSPSGTERILDGIVLAIMIVFGAFLIQSIFREIRLREIIEKQNQEKSEFMSFASHEIRNPITAIRGYASMLVEGSYGQLQPEAKDVAERMMVSGNEVLSLISQFLNKSKLELGQLQYSIAPFDGAALVSATAKDFELNAHERKLTITAQAPTEPLMALGDVSKVKEALGILIDNSLKYTKQGGVTVSAGKSDAGVRLMVEDTGVGIPAATLPNLFQKFSRADAKKMNLLGTGLGLFLCRTYVDAMKGKVWAESDGEGHGSRFIIELPAAPANATAPIAPAPVAMGPVLPPLSKVK